MNGMKQINFTTYVLGKKAVSRLKEYQVTQTLRGPSSDAVESIISGEIKPGDQIQIMLDGQNVGLAQFVIMDSVCWADLNHDDAIRGGFDSLDDLRNALYRAGYRFQPINSYYLFRIQFSWLPEEGQ